MSLKTHVLITFTTGYNIEPNGTNNVLVFHTLSTRFFIVSICLSLYCTISNQSVVGSIMVKVFSMRGSY